MKEKVLSAVETLELKLASMQERNKDRAEAAKASMGQKYLLHPSNRVVKKESAKFVLG